MLIVPDFAFGVLDHLLGVISLRHVIVVTRDLLASVDTSVLFGIGRFLGRFVDTFVCAIAT